MEEVIINFLSGNSSIIIYASLLVILTLCGVGLPLPEDIPLMVAGYLAYQGEVALIPALIVSLIGILLGDSIIYKVGKTYGYDIARMKILRRVFTRKRLKKAEIFFEKHGPKTVFFGRFVAGARAATFFIAGMMKMRYSSFIALDAIAAAISVPIWIFGAYFLALHFGEDIERMWHVLGVVKYYITIGAVLAILIMVLFYFRKPTNGFAKVGAKQPGKAKTPQQL